MSSGILTSIPEYQRLRHAAIRIDRHPDSHVDLVRTAFDDTVDDSLTNENATVSTPICSLSAILPFTFGTNSNIPIRRSFEDVAAISLAIQHLNTGDGSLVPQVQGLNQSCPIRFLVEANDLQWSNVVAISHMVDQTRRPVSPSDRPQPCAFLGAYRSSASIPMALVGGILGYPQISPSSTTVELDDKSQYPLFARTIPSDAGNAVPLVIYLTQVLKLRHLAVLNINDAFGNGFVETMRQAAEIHAPDLELLQYPLDVSSPSSIETAVTNFKNSKFRFAFGLLFTQEEHDTLMEEAFRQGVAGDGKHNWIFGDSFQAIENTVFPLDSPLSKSYRGVGYVEIAGGVSGFFSFDRFVEQLAQLHNPQDLALLESLYPKIDLLPPEDGADETTASEENGEGPYFIPDFLSDPEYLLSPSSQFTPYMYEATIAAGLSACASYDPNTEVLTGVDHYQALVQNTEIDGVTGRVAFDNETGTREPAGALYKVVNYVVDETSEEGVTFRPVTTHFFRESEWQPQDEPYLFNDGTANLPVDIAPAPSDGRDAIWPIAVPVAIAVFLGLVWVGYRENVKRQKNDAVWLVKTQELTFNNPPDIIGRGTFGLVLLAEYRGTQVAVKRTVPPNSSSASKSTNMGHNRISMYFNEAEVTTSGGETTVRDDRTYEGETEHEAEKLSSHGLDGIGEESSLRADSERFFESQAGMSASQGNYGSWTNLANRSSLAGKSPHLTRQLARKMKDDFIEEMRHLSRLRHPCITTVMGAVIESTEDPMLVMEYMDHGSLYDMLHNETIPLDGEILLPILRDISQGMRFLHSADPQVLHGDVKAANILVDNRFRAKVADFGLSQKKNLGGTGTPYWMAPELLRRDSANSSASDVFSFGVVLYEVFSRREPYAGEKPVDVLRDIKDKNIQKRVATPKNMPDTIQLLMRDCHEEDPTSRPSFSEIDTRLKRIDVESVPSAQVRSHVSLFDIFPKEVAEALRDGRKVEATHKDCVTIFFSDIVGFTDISATLDARKVANMLDRLYHKFDNLSTSHDVYKVETIGDAFIAVANLVKDQPDDHCKRIAEFAIATIKAANQTLVDEEDPSKGTVNIRVGFHSGPVVADVVGNRNPRYCLFGDTVNTASRMESNSKPNRINCSKQSADLLRKQSADILLRRRGELSIKGKGKMKCYWVNETPVLSKEFSGLSLHSSASRSGTTSMLEEMKGKPGATSMLEEARASSSPALFGRSMPHTSFSELPGPEQASAKNLKLDVAKATDDPTENGGARTRMAVDP